MENFQMDLEILESYAKTRFRNWKTDEIIYRVQQGIKDRKIPAHQIERAIQLVKFFEKIPSDGSFPGSTCQ
jgi:hypothetical protein